MAQMTLLTIEAHSIDGEFEKLINENGVTIIDRTNEPWSVVFRGERAKLIEMVKVHWDEDRAYGLGAELCDEHLPCQVPVEILRSLISMAQSHVEDINSGIEDGTYLASENEGIGEKEAHIASAEQALMDVLQRG